MGFPVLAEPVPIELVNTVYAERGQRREGLATPADLAAWLQAHQAQLGGATDKGAQDSGSPTVEHEHVAAFRELRAALHALFDAALGRGGPPPEAVAALNAASRLAPGYPILAWPPGGEPYAACRAAPAPSLDPVLAALVAVARAGIDLLAGLSRHRLAACAGPGCVLYFLQTHPRRSFCTPGCSNRARAARHYRRGRSR